MWAEQFAEADAGAQDVRPEIVEAGEAGIGQDQLFVAVEQAQALRHVGQGGIEIA